MVINMIEHLQCVFNKGLALFRHTERRMGKLLFVIFRIAFLICVGYIVIYPLFHMLTTSIQSKYAFLNSTRIWIPNDLNIKGNYQTAILCLDYATSLISTFKNELIAALIQVGSCAIAAYGFARFEFKGKRLKLALLVLTIIVPDTMLLIPRMASYSHLDFLGLLGLLNRFTGIDLRPRILNTVLTFWLPALFGVGLKSGMLIYIYIQFFKGLPKELEEAAWVDGAGPVRTFLSIAIPSSGVVIITVTIFSVIWHWNDSVLGGLYLTDEYPLAVQITRLQALLGNKAGLLFGPRDPESMAIVMAACVLFVAPMLIMYMILQKWFIESIDRVGITG